MERQYVFWRTSRAFWTAAVTFPLAFVLATLGLIVFHERPWLQLSAVVVVCWPLILLPFRLDRRAAEKDRTT